MNIQLRFYIVIFLSSLVWVFTGAVYAANEIITIQAEDYDLGGEGIAYHDITTENSGNTDLRPDEGVDLWNVGDGTTKIGSVRTGEWVNYTSNFTAGSHRFVFYLSSPNDNGTVDIYLNDVKKTEIVSTNTGSYANFVEHTLVMDIPAGENIVKVEFTGESVDFDRFTIERILMFERPVKITWDADSEADLCPEGSENCFKKWQYIRFYYKPKGTDILIEKEECLLSQGYVDGFSTPTEAECTFPYNLSEKSTNVYVLKAGAVIDGKEVLSPDSDPVELEVDPTKLPPKQVENITVIPLL